MRCFYFLIGTPDLERLVQDKLEFRLGLVQVPLFQVIGAQVEMDLVNLRILSQRSPQRRDGLVVAAVGVELVALVEQRRGALVRLERLDAGELLEGDGAGVFGLSWEMLTSTDPGAYPSRVAAMFHSPEPIPPTAKWPFGSERRRTGSWSSGSGPRPSPPRPDFPSRRRRCPRSAPGRDCPAAPAARTKAAEHPSRRPPGGTSACRLRKFMGGSSMMWRVRSLPSPI